MSDCKRMTVIAMGSDREGNVAYATNYNPGECTGEPGSCGCVHAERALLEKMPEPRSVAVSHSPCLDCAAALVEAGVEFVYFLVPYRKTEGWDYLYAHGVITQPMSL